MGSPPRRLNWSRLKCRLKCGCYHSHPCSHLEFDAAYTRRLPKLFFALLIDAVVAHETVRNNARDKAQSINISQTVLLTHR